MADYACALIIKNGCVLLGRRAPYRKTYPNKWDVIGGKAEDGETLEETLRRELGEEIGINPQRERYFTTLKDQAINPASPPNYHYYIVDDWVGTPSICNHEHTEIGWFPFSQASALPDLALNEYPALFSRLSNECADD